MMQYTIFAAYHLILETSFFEDQRSISLDTHIIKEQSLNILNSDMEKPDSEKVKENSSNGNDSTLGNLHDDEIERGGFSPQEKHHSLFLSPSFLIKYVSTSIKKSFEDTFPLQTSSFEPVSSYLGFEEENKQASYHENDHAIQYISPDNESIISSKNIDVENIHHVCNVVDTPQKKNIDVVLDVQSILVLFSKRNILKNIACEERNLIRIKYYGNFDTTLGRFLQDILQVA